MKRILLTATAAIALTASAGFAAADREKFMFRWKGSVLAQNGTGNGGSGDTGSGSEAGDGSGGADGADDGSGGDDTGDDGGDDDTGGGAKYVEVTLSNGWTLNCDAAAGATDGSLAHLVGNLLSLYVDTDVIYSGDYGDGPLGVLAFYTAERIPEQTQCGLEAYIEKQGYGCARNSGHWLMPNGWSIPARDGIVGGSLNVSIAHARVTNDEPLPPYDIILE